MTNNTKLNNEISREYDVLRIAYVDGQYVMVEGENENCPALKDIKKNWSVAVNFEPQKNNNISSLSGFMRNFVEKSLTQMNDGNIARGIKFKSENELKTQVSKLEESINISLYGIEGNKELKIKKRIGLDKKVSNFKESIEATLKEIKSNKKIIINNNDNIEEKVDELEKSAKTKIDDVKKAQYSLDYFKIKKSISQLEVNLGKYNKSKFVDSEIYADFNNKIKDFSKSLEDSYKKIS